MEEYLNQLNEQQRNAVTYTDGPSLVIAGAGSGKTRVLTYKIVHLIESGYTPYRILALTFTNKAAKEMKERIELLVGHDVASKLWMGTFHSIFSKILRINAERLKFRSDFTIYDSNDSKSLIKVIIKDMQLDDKTYKPSFIQSHISNMKNALISPQNYENDRDLRQADERANRPLMYAIYKAYWNRCFVSGAMDFDDLLFYTNILLRDNPDILAKYQDFFQYILVDEYQDTNFAQHLIVSQLSKLHKKVCVVGDDAQSIYSFRGANINNILSLNKYYDNLKTFKLEQNYRSTQTIIDAANSLIEKNTQQIPKHIFSDNSIGNKIAVIQSYSDFEESYVVANHIISIKSRQGDSFNDFAILYRTNAQSRVLEEALRKRNIPYKIYGGLSFYQRKEIKDAIAYFRLSINPNDDEALRRIINYPSRGIGETTVGKLQQAAIHHNVSIWNVITDIEKYELKINAGTHKKLTDFKGLIESFIEKNDEKETAFNLAEYIIQKSKLLAVVQNDNTPENISKQENISELLNGVKDFVSAKEEVGDEDTLLTNFLAEVSLATDQDNADESGTNVTMMTVHASKGLEFKNVIIVGVEEDLFPSSMSLDSIYAIEEERRLLYVAITRAKVSCILSFATSRYKNGQTKGCTMSRFIKDINPAYLSLAQTSSSSSHRDDDIANEIMLPSSSSFKPVKEIVSKPQFINTNKTSNSNSENTSHTVEELENGTKIQHSRFGIGKISKIDTTGSDAKIVVDFESVGTKTLLLKYAKFSIIN